MQLNVHYIIKNVTILTSTNGLGNPALPLVTGMYCKINNSIRFRQTQICPFFQKQMKSRRMYVRLISINYYRLCGKCSAGRVVMMQVAFQKNRTEQQGCNTNCTHCTNLFHSKKFFRKKKILKKITIFKIDLNPLRVLIGQVMCTYKKGMFYKDTFGLSH